MRKANVLVALQFSLLFGLLLASHFSSNTTYYPVTTALMFSGLTILVFAFFALRPSLRVSPIPREGAPLIIKGIYKYVRHPMYFALLLIGMAFAANASNVIGWVLYIVLIAVLNFKANYEDGLLRAIHPEATHYQMHTSKILPCLGGSCRDNCGLN